MASCCIRAKKLIANDDRVVANAWVKIEAGIIKSISSEAPEGGIEELSENLHETYYVIPGFVNMHIHGRGGSKEILNYYLHPAASAEIMAKKGTTSFLASLSVDVNDVEHTFACCRAIQKYMETSSPGKAACLGVHLEGPAVQDPGGLPRGKTWTVDQFFHFVDACGSIVKAVTLSPSVDAQGERIEGLLMRGILPCLGHDRVVKEETMMDLIQRFGPKKLHITHTFNVQTFHHRNVGLANLALLQHIKGHATPSCEVIVDDVHVHPWSVQLLIEQRWRDLCVITDAVADGKEQHPLTYGGRKAIVEEDAVYLEKEHVLCGGCGSMLSSLQKLLEMGISWERIVRICCCNPARILDRDEVGTIQVNQKANMCLLDKQGKLIKVICGGEWVESI